MNAPASTVYARYSTSTGDVPRTDSYSGTRRMPHSTEVGQSGPPHRMATFAGESPGCMRQYLMARICTELIPTVYRTPT